MQAGKNYGWPLVSKGLKYDGTPVDYGNALNIQFDINTLQGPVVDLTPSPAVSSFVIYDGKAFPRWKGNLIVGTLKATELYRMVVDGDRVVHRETLLSGTRPNSRRRGRTRRQSSIFCSSTRRADGSSGSCRRLERSNSRSHQRRTTMRITAVLVFVLFAGLPAPAFGQSFVGDSAPPQADSPAGKVSETITCVKTKDGYAITAKLVGVPEGTPEAGPGTDIVLSGDSFSYKRSGRRPRVHLQRRRVGKHVHRHGPGR